MDEEITAATEICANRWTNGKETPPAGQTVKIMVQVTDICPHVSPQDLSRLLLLSCIMASAPKLGEGRIAGRIGACCNGLLVIAVSIPQNNGPPPPLARPRHHNVPCGCIDGPCQNSKCSGDIWPGCLVLLSNRWASLCDARCFVAEDMKVCLIRRTRAYQRRGNWNLCDVIHGGNCHCCFSPLVKWPPVWYPYGAYFFQNPY